MFSKKAKSPTTMDLRVETAQSPAQLEWESDGQNSSLDIRQFGMKNRDGMGVPNCARLRAHLLLHCLGSFELRGIIRNLSQVTTTLYLYSTTSWKPIYIAKI